MEHKPDMVEILASGLMLTCAVMLTIVVLYLISKIKL